MTANQKGQAEEFGGAAETGDIRVKMPVAPAIFGKRATGWLIALSMFSTAGQRVGCAGHAAVCEPGAEAQSGPLPWSGFRMCDVQLVAVRRFLRFRLADDLGIRKQICLIG